MMNRCRESCELTKRSGNIITQAMVSHIETGEDNVKIDTLRGFARAFGWAVMDLLPEEDSKKAKFRTARAEGTSADRHPAVDRSGQTGRTGPLDATEPRRPKKTKRYNSYNSVDVLWRWHTREDR